MKLSLKPQHLRRYKEIAPLLFRHANADVVEQIGVRDDFASADPAEPPSQPGKPEELAQDLEQMGPTFIKLGQVLSTRPDLLPDPYLKVRASRTHGRSDRLSGASSNPTFSRTTSPCASTTTEVTRPG